MNNVAYHITKAAFCKQGFPWLVRTLLCPLLTNWGWVTHIRVSKLTITDLDNGLSLGRCQAIVWTNARMLLIGPLGTNFSEILMEIHIFSYKRTHPFKVSSVRCRPFSLGLKVLSLVFSIKSESQSRHLYSILFKRQIYTPGNGWKIWYTQKTDTNNTYK